ncbi:MAG: AAA family ATPase, partial [Cenarchaeum sp. SB0675_bin_21]|nr:AAA family ATPase [Cenarchaeum sp. SB0675_bin_21]
MNYNKLIVRNFGPVLTGEIGNEKIIVLFGSNNSGKSMISKLIHTFSMFDLMMSNKFSDWPIVNKLKISTDRLMTYYVLNNLSLRPHQLITYGQSNSYLTVENDKKAFKLVLSDNIERNELRKYTILSHYLDSQTQSQLQSLYIPAGRTGAIEFFYTIAQMRHRLLRDILVSFAGYDYQQETFSAPDLKQFLRSAGSFPNYMNEFYDMILDAYTKGMTKDFQNQFSTLFSGRVYTEKESVAPSIIFEDPKGFLTNLENSGSGVISSLPILLGIEYVENGGRLIIEEPEAHLEPTRQFALMEMLHTASTDKKIKLVITTHSDYIVKKLLSMVNQKVLEPSDLGLYYFERPTDQY